MRLPKPHPIGQRLQGPGVLPAKGVRLCCGHGVGLFKVGPLLAKMISRISRTGWSRSQQRSGFPPATCRGTRPLAGLSAAGARMHGVVQEEAPDASDDYLRRALPDARSRRSRESSRATSTTSGWPPIRSIPNEGLFDSDRYTGQFSSYDKMHGYYASTGGGGAVCQPDDPNAAVSARSGWQAGRARGAQ